MLPDFPDVKKNLHRSLTTYLRDKVHFSDPVLAMMGRSFQHEGDKAMYETVEGEENQIDYQKYESLITITREEAKTLTLPKILARISKIAADMTNQMAKTVFSTIEQSANKVGNTIDAKGEFDFDTIIKALEILWIEFDDETKQPKMPTLVVGPELATKLATKLSEWQQNEEYNERFNEVIKKKYQEWDARESNRKLVD